MQKGVIWFSRLVVDMLFCMCMYMCTCIVHILALSFHLHTFSSLPPPPPPPHHHSLSLHISLHAGVKFIYTITSSKMVTRGIKISMPDCTNVCFVFLSAVGTTANVLFVSKCIDLTDIYLANWPLLLRVGRFCVLSMMLSRYKLIFWAILGKAKVTETCMWNLFKSI